MTALDHLETEDELEQCLSAPSEQDIACCRRLDGDILVLGAGGKMGPSLVRRVARAMAMAASSHRTIAVSRFSSPSMRKALDEVGATTIAADLVDPTSTEHLPDTPWVLFLAGRKFGSTDNPSLTWATNTIVPANVARRFAGSRIVAFSTGNVYPFVQVTSRGSTETDPLLPHGEYAQSCLGRERVFEYYSRENGTPTLLFRLNYAVDLRYGVLVDIARAVRAARPVDRTVSHFNAIWQGDANSYALRCLEGCASPPVALNVTGPEILSVTEVAEYFGRRFGTRPVFSGVPRGDALLSDARRCHQWLGLPEVPATSLMSAVASWIERDGRTLDKPTHFEATGGQF
jgi:nucleoside-diphosphate-sugar epimerase